VRDSALFLLTILAFAGLLTAHLAIALALFRRGLRLRAFVALLVPPFAPYWALRERMAFRGSAWLAAAIVYVLARLLQ
jgi:hypothetical protein